MLGPGRGIDWLNRLGVRLAVLLSVALLPLGLIALLQTYRVVDETRQRAEAALIARTAEAAAVEKELIQTAIGAAEAFGVAVRQVRDDHMACEALFRRFVDASDVFVFAGYMDARGMMRCTSEGVSMNLAGSPDYRALVRDPRTSVRRSQRGPISGEAVVMVTVPVLADGAFDGAITVSVPHAALLEEIFTPTGLTPVDIVTFNAEGEVLTSAVGLDGVARRLPEDRALRDLAEAGTVSFTGTTEARGERIFSVVPMIEDTVFALASWSPEAVPGALRALSLPSVTIPVMMWLVSLGVAYFAVHRLVIRHIRDLRHRIRVFSSARRTLAMPETGDMPAELREVCDAFQAMTRRIIADEADLENSIHDKNVLLREVHHRVKNNLQLITSMISMQQRRCESPEIRRILRRLQDRVQGLAVIHQNLNHASSLSRVRADILLREIVEQMLNRALGPSAAVRVTHELDETTLYPDQALPLALLANEAVTNAMKYLGAPEDGQPWIDVRLAQGEEGEVTFTVENSAGSPVSEAIAEDGEGLGSQLMQAFVTQIGGTVETAEEADRYRLELRFRIAEFDASAAPAAAAQ